MGLIKTNFISKITSHSIAFHWMWNFCFKNHIWIWIIFSFCFIIPYNFSLISLKHNKGGIKALKPIFWTFCRKRNWSEMKENYFPVRDFQSISCLQMFRLRTGRKYSSKIDSLHLLIHTWLMVLDANASRFTSLC